MHVELHSNETARNIITCKNRVLTTRFNKVSLVLTSVEGTLLRAT